MHRAQRDDSSHIHRARGRRSLADGKKTMTDADNPDTLGEAIPREMARVRDEVLPAYLEIGVAGVFASAAIRAGLDDAAKALAEGDVVAMLRIYQALKEAKT